MIKLDLTKMYYLSHPCTSVGTMGENGRFRRIDNREKFYFIGKAYQPS